MKHLNKSNIPSLFLLAYIVRILITGASIGDALAIIGLAALSGAVYYIESIKPEPLNEELRREVDMLKTSISALRLGANRNVR